MANLVVFGEDWGGLPSSTQHLVRHLLSHHRVIWVNSIGLRSPKPGFRDLLRLFKKTRALFRSADKTSHQTLLAPIVIDPKVIPFHGVAWIRNRNKRWLIHRIQTVCAEQGFDDIILWTSLPTAVDVVGELNEKASIYYCGDDFNALNGVDHLTVTPMERELVQKVDVILAASEPLANKFPSSKTLIFPHGVDFKRFSTPSAKPADMPDQGAVAGFYGSLSDWLDVDLMAQTVTAMPNWTFMFIGAVNTRIGVLEELPNVVFLGPEHTISCLPMFNTGMSRYCPSNETVRFKRVTH